MYAVFRTLNSRRKGYLDLADIYSLMEDASEDELFVVFKYLDWSRSGKVEMEDLLLVTGGREKRVQDCDVGGDGVKFSREKLEEFLNIVRENHSELEVRKRQMKVDRQSLGDVYQRILKLSPSKGDCLAKENLISFLNLEWGLSKDLTNEVD